MCVCERERERDRESMWMCVHLFTNFLYKFLWYKICVGSSEVHTINASTIYPIWLVSEEVKNRQDRWWCLVTYMYTSMQLVYFVLSRLLSHFLGMLQLWTTFIDCSRIPGHWVGTEWSRTVCEWQRGWQSNWLKQAWSTSANDSTFWQPSSS